VLRVFDEVVERRPLYPVGQLVGRDIGDRALALLEVVDAAALGLVAPLKPGVERGYVREVRHLVLDRLTRVPHRLLVLALRPAGSGLAGVRLAQRSAR
jgi:hypothetical protein